jgi:hypothetical protein
MTNFLANMSLEKRVIALIVGWYLLSVGCFPAPLFFCKITIYQFFQGNQSFVGVLSFGVDDDLRSFMGAEGQVGKDAFGVGGTVAAGHCDIALKSGGFFDKYRCGSGM